jgi:L-amino acid N-acyltransferase YncA
LPAKPIHCHGTCRADDALAYWFSAGHDVFVAEDAGAIVGTYFLKANQKGGGSHVANWRYVVAPDTGARGIGRAMCEDSLRRATARGFRAMQFNFVVELERARGAALASPAGSRSWGTVAGSIRPSGARHGWTPS